MGNLPDAPLPNRGATRWDRFLYWAGRFQESPEFDDIERDYKLVVTARLVEARDAMLAGDPGWVEKLTYAVTAKPNNLSNWHATQPFLAWCQGDPETAGLAFRLLWNESVSDVATRMDQFAEVTSRSGKKLHIAETAFFHMAMGVEAYPMFRATPFERATQFTGYPSMKEAGIKQADLGRRYKYFIQFLDNLMKRAAANGIAFRDRLDAQSAMWVVTEWQPLNDWSDDERQAFRAYQQTNLRPGKS